MVCRDFILPEPASYVFFYALFNLRNLLYIIADSVALQSAHGAAPVKDKNQFCHNENPPSFDYALIVANPKEGLVA